MGAGGGATVAIIVAAREKRFREIVDAFRVSGATEPGRSRSLAEIGVMHEGEVAELANDGVLVAGRTPGSWYLDEAAFIARRERRSSSARMVVIISVVVLLVGLIAVYITRRQP